MREKCFTNAVYFLFKFTDTALLHVNKATDKFGCKIWEFISHFSECPGSIISMDKMVLTRREGTPRPLPEVNYFLINLF